MVGPYYAAPPKSAGWNSVANNLIATLAENHARTVDQKYKNQLASALASSDPSTALSQMAQNNPYAQQLVLSQALKGAPTPNWTKVDMQTPQGIQTGFVDKNSQDPTSTFRPLGAAAPAAQPSSVRNISMPSNWASQAHIWITLTQKGKAAQTMSR